MRTSSEHVSSTHVVINDRAHSLRCAASARRSVGAVVLHAGHIYATRAWISLACRYAEFKVVGNASVHLSGYYMPEHGYGE